MTKKIFDEIMPVLKHIIDLDPDYRHFSGTGPPSIKLQRIMGLNGEGSRTSAKLSSRMTNDELMHNIEDVNGLEVLKVKMARVEKMIEAVDANTSSKAICFGNIQLRSKKETREFVANMKQPSLRGFYDIISLLDLCHADQSYEEGLHLEFKSNRTGYDNVEDALIFLSFRNTLPRVLAGKGESEATNKPASRM